MTVAVAMPDDENAPKNDAGPEEDLPKDGPLTDEQRERFALLQSQIRDLRDSQGDAFYEIFRHRLYREIHPTFTGYLALCWPDVSRATAYRRINHHEVVAELDQVDPDLPKPSPTISQLLHDKPDMVKKWRECVEQGLTTEQAVRQNLQAKKPKAIAEAIAPEIPKPLALKLALHVPDEYVDEAMVVLSPCKHVLKDGRDYLRKRVGAEEAAEWLIQVGQFLKDNSINPFTLTVSL